MLYEVITKAASNFLAPSLHRVRSPFALKDMDAAVNRISRAITENEKILIFGDYDVDGITATAVLLGFLQTIGADVSRITSYNVCYTKLLREPAYPCGANRYCPV